MVRAKARELGPMDGRADGVAARRSLTSRAGVRRCVAVGLALVMVSGMAGCGGGDAGAGGTPSVSGGASVTPSVTPTPTPSEDPLFTEAKAVHLKYLDQVLRLEKAGGASRLPDEMRVLVTGQYMKDVEAAYARLAKLGTKADPSSQYHVVSVRQSTARDGGIVAIRACVDARKVILLDKTGKRAGRGTLRQDDLSFVKVGDSLAISDGDSVRVDACEK
jgi:hypothetical protein